MNEENELDQIADADAIHRPIERVMREEIMEVFKHAKIGEAPGPSEVYSEMILASGEDGIRVLKELYQRKLDRNAMPANWATSVAIPIFYILGTSRTVACIGV